MIIFRNNKIGRSLLFCLGAILALAMESCGNNHDGRYYDNRISGDDVHSGTPYIMVYFVPLDGFSEKDAEQLSKEFYNNFAESRREPYSVATLAHKTTPGSCLNDSKSRFRARKIMKWLSVECANEVKSITDGNEALDCSRYFIGVTDKDISTSIHNHEDYGIFGLSYLGKGDVSIISTHRLKRRKDLWKLAVHEFCHGFYGCPHCKEDPHCIMADAKGGNPHFETKDSLCVLCANFCLK